jgi:hypothetical protein
MGDYRISIIDSFDQLEMLRNNWNELLGKSARPNLFLSWEWITAWAENFIDNKRKLFILLVYESDELIGIAPWCINYVKKAFLSFRQIEFLGTPETGSDYLDVFIRKGKEKDVAYKIYNFLLGDAVSYWDRLRLHDIPCNSTFLLFFLNLISETGKYSGFKEASFCPVMVLPNSEDDFFTQISLKRSKRFKQDLRNLKKEDSIEFVTCLSENFDTCVNDFFAFYEKKTPWNGSHILRQVRKFVEKMGDTGGVQIDFLTANKSTIGALLHLRFNDTLYLYLMAVDKEYNPRVSVGNTLVGLAILNAINSGIKYYDFLKGVEEYKFYWTSFGNRSCSVLFTQKKIAPIFWIFKDIMKSTAKIFFR